MTCMGGILISNQVSPEPFKAIKVTFCLRGANDVCYEVTRNKLRILVLRCIVLNVVLFYLLLCVVA